MSDAKAYAQRNQKGSDWFSHDATTAKQTASAPSVSPTRTASDHSSTAASEDAQGRAQMIKPKCNSNDWFKHDKEAVSQGDVSAPPVSAPVAVEEEIPVEKASAASKVAREGDMYGRRDKAGSSASWFSHEHPGEANAAAGATRISKEGGKNATRMRGESENWFNHEANKTGDDSGVTTGKGRGNKPQSDEMKQIFNMGK